MHVKSGGSTCKRVATVHDNRFEGGGIKIKRRETWDCSIFSMACRMARAAKASPAPLIAVVVEEAECRRS